MPPGGDSERMAVEAAGAVEAQNAPTSSLENTRWVGVFHSYHGHYRFLVIEFRAARLN
jgi:hypothetical protein